MPVRRLLPVLLALCLGVCASLLLACGNDENLIPSDDAQSINEALDQAKQRIEDHECEVATQAASQVQERVRALPTSVNRKLRERLRSGAQTLVERAEQTCLSASTTTETVPADTETTAPETTATETTQTETTQTDTTTEPPPTDTGTGGASPDGTGTVTP